MRDVNVLEPNGFECVADLCLRQRQRGARVAPQRLFGKVCSQLEGKLARSLDEVAGGPLHDAVFGPAVGQPGIRQLNGVEQNAISIVLSKS